MFQRIRPMKLAGAILLLAGLTACSPGTNPETPPADDYELSIDTCYDGWFETSWGYTIDPDSAIDCTEPTLFRVLSVQPIPETMLSPTASAAEQDAWRAQYFADYHATEGLEVYYSASDYEFFKRCSAEFAHRAGMTSTAKEAYDLGLSPASYGVTTIWQLTSEDQWEASGPSWWCGLAWFDKEDVQHETLAFANSGPENFYTAGHYQFACFPYSGDDNVDCDQWHSFQPVLTAEIVPALGYSIDIDNPTADDWQALDNFCVTYTEAVLGTSQPKNTALWAINIYLPHADGESPRLRCAVGASDLNYSIRGQAIGRGGEMVDSQPLN